MAYAVTQAFDEALREFEQARRLSASDPYLDGLSGYVQAMAGNPDKAREIIKELAQKSRQQYVPAFAFALVHIGLGNLDEAFEWLEKAWEDRSTYLVFAKSDPLLDPVRSDPRLTELLRRMGLL